MISDDDSDDHGDYHDHDHLIGFEYDQRLKQEKNTGLRVCPTLHQEDCK